MRELAGHGDEISPGTLYPTLHRPESEMLLSSRRAVEEGRARRVHKITADGRRALRRTRIALRELAAEVLDD
jgi:DNA-binding PadR family transcriptional regulator